MFVLHKNICRVSCARQSADGFGLLILEITISLSPIETHKWKRRSMDPTIDNNSFLCNDSDNLIFFGPELRIGYPLNLSI